MWYATKKNGVFSSLQRLSTYGINCVPNRVNSPKKNQLFTTYCDYTDHTTARASPLPPVDDLANIAGDGQDPPVLPRNNWNIRRRANHITPKADSQPAIHISTDRPVFFVSCLLFCIFLQIDNAACVRRTHAQHTQYITNQRVGSNPTLLPAYIIRALFGGEHTTHRNSFLPMHKSMPPSNGRAMCPHNSVRSGNRPLYIYPNPDRIQCYNACVVSCFFPLQAERSSQGSDYSTPAVNEGSGVRRSFRPIL